MKIAINTNELTLKQNTGVKVYTHEIVKALGRIDKENEYILYLNCRERKFSFPTAENFKLKISKSCLPFWTYTKLPQEIKKDRSDILFMPIQAVPFFKKPKNMKIVVTVHDLAFLLFPDHFTRKDRFLLNFHTKRAVKMADKIIVPSEATKRDIIKFYEATLPNPPLSGGEHKIKVIWHGVSSSKYQVASIKQQDKKTNNFPPRRSLSVEDCDEQARDPLQSSNERLQRGEISNIQYPISNQPYILFVGSIQPRKNTMRLIEAFEKVKENHSNPLLLRGNNLKLVICGGKGWMADKIYKRAKESKFSGDIIFTGNISDEERNKLYKNALIFAFPSLYEGFGMPVLEAMSYGVPCVVGDNSSLSEIAGGNALLVDADNSVDIAEKMNLLLSDSELRKDLSRRGIENAKRFSWDEAAKKTLSVLSSK